MARMALRTGGLLAGLAVLCVVAVIGVASSKGRVGMLQKLDEFGRDDYHDLLGREKQTLNSGKGGIDWGNERFMANAGKEQDLYIQNKNAQAAVEVKQGMKDAAQLYAKWNNPYKNTEYAKYDAPQEDTYADARTESLALQQPAGGRAQQQELAFSKVRAKAVATCKGDAGCEQVLGQVMGLFGRK
eukprot:CAMPEP_0173383844 /NCGR_PEP_ID=MMETSP1356-20130122/6417_1 /TAXON_ID=77927 ORGANISM="Hemiselmis virescens, Strain PCC157" /NCGR_SAMPLE_ID=MMETSP1356 /ASSEMBLY_ACC=CAM_ASM_000847 /LENGTH=185 /DNA_ID=CAMNT_0014338903 /DNA_START=10 /DNA_END=567 /DNA_ORIENTATION=-